VFRYRQRAPTFNASYPSAREIAAKLKGETRPDRSGNYSCRCPGPMHKNGDANPSLSVKDGANGRLLLYCHAGCDYRGIVAALERRGILPRDER
jgi:putative DNA primase/helicase